MYFLSLLRQKRTRRAPDLSFPIVGHNHTPSPLSPPADPHATTACLPRCCRTPATTSALRHRRRLRERCSPPRSPHPPRPSPPLIRWARPPAVICPPPRPSTPRAGTGAPCRGWSLPRATWPPPRLPPPRRRVIQVTTNNTTPVWLSPCRISSTVTTHWFTCDRWALDAMPWDLGAASAIAFLFHVLCTIHVIFSETDQPLAYPSVSERVCFSNQLGMDKDN